MYLTSLQLSPILLFGAGSLIFFVILSYFESMYIFLKISANEGHLWCFSVRPPTPCRESWCPQTEGLAFYHISSLCFSQVLRLQLLMQSAEVRDLMDDLRLKGGTVVQESQLLFLGLLCGATFVTGRWSSAFTPCHRHCWIWGWVTAWTALFVCFFLKCFLTPTFHFFHLFVSFSSRWRVALRFKWDLLQQCHQPLSFLSLPLLEAERFLDGQQEFLPLFMALLPIHLPQLHHLLEEGLSDVAGNWERTELPLTFSLVFLLSFHLRRFGWIYAWTVLRLC